MKLKLPGVARDDKVMFKSFIEEALARHEEVAIPKCHWAYKTKPLTTHINETQSDFFFIIPYCYATPASDDVLKRGLLESIEFRQDDAHLTAIRLTFNNGKKEMQTPAFGRRLLLDKTLTFRKAISKVVFTYNTGVTQVEFNDDD